MRLLARARVMLQCCKHLEERWLWLVVHIKWQWSLSCAHPRVQIRETPRFKARAACVVQACIQDVAVLRVMVMRVVNEN